jgi:uncharacterized protein
MPTSSNTYLITGGTGFIGRFLAARWLQEGHSVLVLSRDPHRAQQRLPAGAEAIGDLAQIPQDRPITHLVNLAGARILGRRWSTAQKQHLLHSRLDTTDRLLRWAEQRHEKPRCLISASAIGYYGIQARGDNRSLDETAPSQALFMSELCQRWEARAETFTELGIPVIIMRLGVVLGHQGALPQMLAPIRCGLGGPLAGGTQWLSWIHLEDVARALNFMLEQTPSQPLQIVNFTAPEPVQQKTFAAVAAQLLHRPCWLPTPGFAFRWLLGEQADLLLEGQKIIPAQLLSLGFTFLYPTLKSALQQILRSD